MQCWRECQHMSDRIPGKMSDRMPRHILECIARFFSNFWLWFPERLQGGHARAWENCIATNYKIGTKPQKTVRLPTSNATIVLAHGENAQKQIATHFVLISVACHGYDMDGELAVTGTRSMHRLGSVFCVLKCKKHQHHFFKKNEQFNMNIFT